MTVAAYTGSIEPPTPHAGPAAMKTQRVIRRPDGSHLTPRHDPEQAAPSGFAWGFGVGAGPAQAALAILTDCTGDDGLALKLCKAFKWGVISQLPVDEGWALTVDEVRRWVLHHEPMASTLVPWARHDASGDGAVGLQ